MYAGIDQDWSNVVSGTLTVPRRFEFKTVDTEAHSQTLMQEEPIRLKLADGV